MAIEHIRLSQQARDQLTANDSGRTDDEYAH